MVASSENSTFQNCIQIKRNGKWENAKIMSLELMVDDSHELVKVDLGCRLNPRKHLLRARPIPEEDLNGDYDGNSIGTDLMSLLCPPARANNALFDFDVMQMNAEKMHFEQVPKFLNVLEAKRMISLRLIEESPNTPSFHYHPRFLELTAEIEEGMNEFQADTASQTQQLLKKLDGDTFPDGGASIESAQTVFFINIANLILGLRVSLSNIILSGEIVQVLKVALGLRVILSQVTK